MQQSETFETLRYLVPPGPKGEPFTLVAFGDVHRFGKLCSDEKWLGFLDWCKGLTNPLYLGMGDYTDLYSASERRAIDTDGLHEQSLDTLEDFYYEQMNRFAAEIAFMAKGGRLIGLLEGNHHIKFQSGITSTQYLCQKLKTSYLGNQAFVKLKWRDVPRPGAKMAALIFAAHGISSSARTVSGGMGAVERMEMIGTADVYLQGHSHQRGALPFSKIDLVDTKDGKMKVIERRGYFVRTGSFTRSWVSGQKSYGSNRLYRPADLGCVPIIFDLKRIKSGHQDLLRLDISVTI